MKGHEFSAQLRRTGKYTSVGSYPVFLLMLDGECLCVDCACNEAARIRLSAMTKAKDGWEPACFEINWESELWCAECGGRIEAAYEVVQD